jgi:hypothetical protein
MRLDDGALFVRKAIGLPQNLAVDSINLSNVVKKGGHLNHVNFAITQIQRAGYEAGKPCHSLRVAGSVWITSFDRFHKHLQEVPVRVLQSK